jgi:hypothetical protein
MKTFASGRHGELGVQGMQESTRGTAARPLQRRPELHSVGRTQWVKSQQAAGLSLHRFDVEDHMTGPYQLVGSRLCGVRLPFTEDAFSHETPDGRAQLNRRQ